MSTVDRQRRREPVLQFDHDDFSLGPEDELLLAGRNTADPVGAVHDEVSDAEFHPHRVAGAEYGAARREAAAPRAGTSSLREVR